MKVTNFYKRRTKKLYRCSVESVHLPWDGGVLVEIHKTVDTADKGTWSYKLCLCLSPSEAKALGQSLIESAKHASEEGTK